MFIRNIKRFFCFSKFQQQLVNQINHKSQIDNNNFKTYVDRIQQLKNQQQSQKYIQLMIYLSTKKRQFISDKSIQYLSSALGKKLPNFAYEYIYIKQLDWDQHIQFKRCQLNKQSVLKQLNQHEKLMKTINNQPQMQIVNFNISKYRSIINYHKQKNQNTIQLIQKSINELYKCLDIFEYLTYYNKDNINQGKSLNIQSLLKYNIIAYAQIGRLMIFYMKWANNSIIYFKLALQYFQMFFSYDCQKPNFDINTFVEAMQINYNILLAYRLTFKFQKYIELFDKALFYLKKLQKSNLVQSSIQSKNMVYYQVVTMLADRKRFNKIRKEDNSEVQKQIKIYMGYLKDSKNQFEFSQRLIEDLQKKLGEEN